MRVTPGSRQGAAGGGGAALLRAPALDPSGFDIVGGEAYRDAQFDKLADVVRAALDMDAVMDVIERGA